jgi:hypothetical protein
MLCANLAGLIAVIVGIIWVYTSSTCVRVCVCVCVCVCVLCACVL